MSIEITMVWYVLCGVDCGVCESASVCVALPTQNMHGEQG